MVSFNPLFQRDFSGDMANFRKAFANPHGHQRPESKNLASAHVMSGEQLQNSLAIVYKKMQAVVQTRMQTVGPASSSAPAETDGGDFSPQTVADRIVGFVANRLAQEKANGASEERLRSLYQQALKGAEQGLREGGDIIRAQGLFDGQVQDNYSSTVTRVADGLQKLGEQLFGAPATATPAPGTTPVADTGISASLSQVQLERSRSFEMEVVTQEGDKVKIQVSSGQSFSGQQVGYSAANARIDGFEASFSSYDNLSFSVEGDLNEDELAALNSLFGQVNDVAETFYGGDIEQAFSQAMDVGMDAGQLASFAVNMNQTETVAVRDTYVAVQNMAGPLQHNPFADMFQRLGEFASQVKQSADQLAALENAPSNLQSLYTDLLARLHPDHGHGHGNGQGNDRGNDFQRFLQRLAG